MGLSFSFHNWCRTFKSFFHLDTIDIAMLQDLFFLFATAHCPFKLRPALPCASKEPRSRPWCCLLGSANRFGLAAHPFCFGSDWSLKEDVSCVGAGKRKGCTQSISCCSIQSPENTACRRSKSLWGNQAEDCTALNVLFIQWIHVPISFKPWRQDMQGSWSETPRCCQKAGGPVSRLHVNVLNLFCASVLVLDARIAWQPVWSKAQRIVGDCWKACGHLLESVDDQSWANSFADSVTLAWGCLWKSRLRSWTIWRRDCALDFSTYMRCGIGFKVYLLSQPDHRPVDGKSNKCDRNCSKRKQGHERKEKESYLNIFQPLSVIKVLYLHSSVTSQSQTS